MSTMISFMSASNPHDHHEKASPLPGTPPQPTLQVPVSEAIRGYSPGKVPFSVEFMPPRDDAAQTRLWNAAEAFHDLGVSFASITYGAGGSTRERTMEVAQQLAAKPLTTLMHLTLVDHSAEELRAMLQDYARRGMTNVLALRGDPPGDPLGTWQPTPGGRNYPSALPERFRNPPGSENFDIGIARPPEGHYASDLIELIRNTSECENFYIGIASFPEGHYRAEDLEQDTQVTLHKLRLGADYSITQMFFDVENYLRLRDRLAAADPVHGAKP